MSETTDKYRCLETEMRNGYYRLESDERVSLEEYCSTYKDFLRSARTERTTVTAAIALAEANGFKPYLPGTKLSAGDKVYFNNREKSLCFAVIGTASLAEGASIVAAHLDSPRLDVRPSPLFETDETAYLRTHYYGWVRKYQWFSLPLMMLGVIIMKDGSRIDVSIGDAEDDAKLVIPDLLPHASHEQNKVALSTAHTGEQMNVILGSEPLQDCDGTKAVKLSILKYLSEKYGITEDDFSSAELEIIPAMPVCDVGLDRSLIGAYGHDDRVCAYAALKALINIDTPMRTAVCIFADKEEVANNGTSGMRSAAFDYFFDLLCDAHKCKLREFYHNSFCISADVTSAFDPNFADVFNSDTCAHINRGIAICKYTGFSGKENASDASAELVARLRRVFDSSGVIWQSGEMAKQDAGGGGTVALEMANRDIDTIDAGVPVLGMHSPFEIVSKLDCYMTYKAYRSIFSYNDNK